MVVMYELDCLELVHQQGQLDHEGKYPVSIHAGKSFGLVVVVVHQELYWDYYQ